MATCDPLQPVVLLTDVMDPEHDQSETVLSSDPEKQSPNSHLFQMEQTEPLDLCLNGIVVNGLAMAKIGSSSEENERDDDDVIFVKEYKVNKGRLLKKCILKGGSKGEPRRNPVRKARDTKRFKEYTDVGFDDEEFLSDSVNDESIVEISDTFANDEDSEDWKIENSAKKGKPKRRVFSRKFSHKLGRKRKINATKEEKKVKLEDLESLIESNLLLTKDYVKTSKVLTKIAQSQEHLQTEEERIKNAIDIFKQQALLLTIVKDSDFDLYKFVIG